MADSRDVGNPAEPPARKGTGRAGSVDAGPGTDRRWRPVPECRQQSRSGLVSIRGTTACTCRKALAFALLLSNHMWTPALDVRIDEWNDSIQLVPDPLLPVQFTELLQRPSERTPEQRLVAAVLDEAIRTFCACAGRRGMRHQRLFREAAEWFASRDESWPFAFENVCDALGLEPEWMRRTLGRWQARHATDGACLPTLRLRVAGSRHGVNGRAPGLSGTVRRAC